MHITSKGLYILHVSIDDAQQLGPGTQQLLPEWTNTHNLFDVNLQKFIPHSSTIARIGHCNASHIVMYTAYGNHSIKPDVYVSHAAIPYAIPPVPLNKMNRTNYLHFTEAPAHYMGQPVAFGYDGFVANTREANIWRPMSSLASVHEAIHKLSFEKNRDTIGIWIDNCYPHTRRRIIDELMTSGLPVRSYGLCRHNTGSIGTPHHSIYSETGRKECNNHRLMLAIENNNCVDWVSGNLLQALVCGAIPIIYQIQGLPDYKSMYGEFPHINASKIGWQRKVELVMHNDSYYHYLLYKHKWSKRRDNDESIREKKTQENANYHCSWFSASQSLNKTVSWQRCIYCEDEVSQNDDMDIHDGFYRHIQCPHQKDGYSSFSNPIWKNNTFHKSKNYLRTVTRRKTYDMCEGDCDTDLDCNGSLFCFQRDAHEGVPGCDGNGKFGVDYCTDMKHVLEQPIGPWGKTNV